MELSRQDLRKDVGHVVSRSDKLEANDPILNLLSKPNHFNTEMSVSSGDDMIANHGDASLIVLEKKRWFMLGKTELGKEIAQPEDVFCGMCRCSVFGLCCGQSFPFLQYRSPHDR